MLKRFFDVTLVFVTISLWLPLFLLLSLIVWIKLGWPVYFKQKRPGLMGNVFELVKFRTMTKDRDSRGYFLPDSQRLTPFGHWLRSTSMDELPELFNVVKGNMSLVGPRPLLIEYLDRYSTEQSRRHQVKPGITGWAQINGRNSISWEEKLRMDVWYVDNASFWLDLKILILTFWKVVKRDGISAKGEATMPKFEGTRAETQDRINVEPSTSNIEHSTVKNMNDKTREEGR